MLPMPDPSDKEIGPASEFAHEGRQQQQRAAQQGHDEQVEALDPALDPRAVPRRLAPGKAVDGASHELQPLAARLPLEANAILGEHLLRD
jgi:hypothetical protein